MEHQVFLDGCELPQRWQGRASFTVLDLGFGTGHNFFATWHAWKHDAARCARLHYVAVQTHPVSAADIAGPHPLAEELAAHYPLPLPGLHRLEFTHDGCTLILTLAVGDAQALLPQLKLAADAVYLDGLWPPALLKAVARLARPDARAAICNADAAATKNLAETGFRMDSPNGASYAPAWPRPASWPDNTLPPGPEASRHAIVVGAGMAGACTVHALARRGWKVTLLDAAPGAAAGASGLPVGLMVPHVSPDDAPMSRLTRSGAALMRELIDRVALPAGHWRADGVLQMVDDAHKARPPAAWDGLSLFEIQDTPQGRPARFFPDGAAIEPGALVRHLLACSPGLEVRWNAVVDSLAACNAGWAVRDAKGHTLAEAPVVIVCAALASLQIATGADGMTRSDVLRPVRGQVTLGTQPLPADFERSLPLSGDGHFIPALRAGADASWVMGASFDRGETALVASEAAHAANMAKLRRLSPLLAPLLAPEFSVPAAKAWVGVRCTSPDRLPLVGPVGPGAPGVFMLTALGSRGLSLAALCAELLACQLNDEPWPVEAALGQALSPARFG